MSDFFQVTKHAPSVKLVAKKIGLVIGRRRTQGLKITNRMRQIRAVRVTGPASTKIWMLTGLIGLMTRGARPAGVLPGANETRTSSDRPGMTPDSASRSTSDLSYNDSVGIHFPGSLFSHSAPRTQSSISVASLLRQPSPEGTRPYSQEDIPLTQREARLVHYYSEHLGGWLDCTDATRQFTLRVPEKVKRCPVLCHAVLSFAARHRREDDIADAAYQRCIALLVDRLNEPHASHDETLLCAIVILRFYEQLNGRFCILFTGTSTNICSVFHC